MIVALQRTSRCWLTSSMSSSFRQVTTTMPLLKKDDQIADDDEVELLIGSQKRQTMKFSDLKEKAREEKELHDKDLIRTRLSGADGKKTPTFTLLGPLDIWNIMTKSRRSSLNFHYDRVDLNTMKTKRLKIKQMIVNAMSGDHSIDASIKQVRDWLEKEYVVSVKIEGTNNKKAPSFEEISQKLKEEIGDNRNFLLQRQKK